MKKILNLIYVPLLVLGLSGCEDFLTVESPDQSTSGNYWTTQEAALSGLSAAYSQLYCGGGWRFHEYGYTLEPFREDMIFMGPGASGYGYMTSIFNFTYNASSSLPAYLWNYNYWGLSYSNQVIDKVGAMDPAVFEQGMQERIVAEARFMRGYYHMKLLLNWEKIVVREKYITSEADIDKALSPRDYAWDFIVKDFKYAASKLPLTRGTSDKGRATSAAANAYLGYALLTRSYEEPARKDEFLTEAAEALKADNFDGYSLVPMSQWLGMFNGTNENSSESIFEIQFSPVTSGNAYYKHQMHYWVASEELGGWEGILPSDGLVKEFKKEGKVSTLGGYDSRMYSTLFFQDDYFNDDNGKVMGENYDYWFCEWKQGADGKYYPDLTTAYNKPVFRKFIPIDASAMKPDETAMNIMLMRYANVMLMRAEVLNEQNHPELAKPIINELRARANMPGMQGSSQAEVRAQIEHERIVEFALENYRFYDLRRWGKVKSALEAVGREGFDPSRYNFLFIPQGEIDSNGQIK